MSRENAELVRTVLPGPDTDLVAFFGDDSAEGELARTIGGRARSRRHRG